MYIQYRVFDSSVTNVNDYWSVYDELSSNKIFDAKSYHDITYLIFNNGSRSFNSKIDARKGLSRIQIFCEKYTFPVELFRNFSLKRDDLSELYSSTYDDNPIIVSSPAHIYNHSHHIVLFDIAHISLFPDEVIPHFLYRLDIL